MTFVTTCSLAGNYEDITCQRAKLRPQSKKLIHVSVLSNLLYEEYYKIKLLFKKLQLWTEVLKPQADGHTHMPFGFKVLMYC